MGWKGEGNGIEEKKDGKSRTRFYFIQEDNFKNTNFSARGDSAKSRERILQIPYADDSCKNAVLNWKFQAVPRSRVAGGSGDPMGCGVWGNGERGGMADSVEKAKQST